MPAGGGPPDAEIKIPKTVEEWFRMIREEPDIDDAVKNGTKRLHVAHTNYESGSNIRRSEFLHLRAFWMEHEQGVAP